MAKFMRVLYYAVEFIRFGGSRELWVNPPSADWVDYFDDILDLLLPDGKLLSEWICPLAEALSSDDLDRKVAAIAAHPRTIVWGIHGPDSLHAAQHVHVLSSVVEPGMYREVQDLRSMVGSTGTPSWIKTKASNFLRYLDRNSVMQATTTGIHLGRASSPEFRVLQSMSALAGAVGRYFDTCNAHGAFDLADILVRRARSMTIPDLPIEWELLILTPAFEAIGRARRLHPQHHWHYPLLEAGRSVVIFRNQIKDSLRMEWPPAARPPAYLGRTAYYVRLIRAVLDWEEFRPNLRSRGILPPIVREFREMANALEPSKVELMALGLYSEEDERRYEFLLKDDRFVEGMWLIGNTRFILGDFTCGDHEPLSHSCNWKVRRDFLPGHMARVLYARWKASGRL